MTAGFQNPGHTVFLPKKPATGNADEGVLSR